MTYILFFNRHSPMSNESLMSRSFRFLVLLSSVFSCAAQSEVEYPRQVYWGDTHVHTALSGDAFNGGVRLKPEDAYRFARGEAVVATSGQTAKLERPLDFIVLADHANNIGAAFYRQEYLSNPEFRNSKLGQEWLNAREKLAKGHIDEASLNEGALLPAHRSWQASFRDRNFRTSVWNQVTQLADNYNEPTKFTAFIGYEWTPSEEEGFSQHRVVLFADDSSYADQILPFSSYDSAHEEDLWQFLDRYEKRTGGRVISIPHNSNLTSGRMFALTDSFGAALTKKYASTRARFEPIVEATQIKGDSETHPLISPEDEFADFETWNGWAGWQNGGFLRGRQLSKRPADKIPHEYVRPALQLGLQLKESIGTNPFKFGVIGSTDAHTGLASADEDNFWGKSFKAEPSASRILNERAAFNYQMNASGYAAVWSKENTRKSLFDALIRKETYATTGPRMVVRVFAGFDFDSKDLASKDLISIGYLKGVPMGGDLEMQEGKVPSFLLMANKDPMGANLDRIQVVKGWIQDGVRMERVYDAVYGENREAGSDGRIKPLLSTVDLDTATYTNTVGSAELIGLWEDPDFVPGQPAVYYVRVLEIPTPRWTLYDKVRYGLGDLPVNTPLTIQERAYTSAIWLIP